MKRSDDSGILSIDFLVGFTIFLLAFIWVVSMIPGLLINLQGYTIDYDAVAYRTGVILAEDPGEPSLPTSITPWESLLSSKGVVRFGLALSKDTPNILSQRKVDRFFDNTTFSYPVDYQNRTIFGDYPYQFNISLIEVGSNQSPRYVGDIMPATSSYGSIRRFVKIKGPSIGMVNASSYDVSGSYNKTAHPEYLNGENETMHEFSILINNTELLHGKVKDQAYQIDPSKDLITVNFTKLNQTMYPDRKDCFNISLTDINVRNAQLIRLDPLPEYKSVIDGIPYNQSSTLQQNISNNISLIFNPPTYWSGIEQIYINLTFNLTPNPVCNAGIFSGTDPVRGSRFLNNTFKSPFNYNYNSSNVLQPQLRDAVLEINVGSGARTVTEIVIEGLNAAFKYSVTSGSPNIAVQFTDQSTGTPVEWAWDFNNDGVVDSTTNNPSYNYGASSGTKTITLTVKDATGASASITKTIDLSAPVAGFSGSPLTGPEPLVVQFTGTYSGGTPTSWKWEYNKTVAGSWTQFNTTSQNPVNAFTDGTYDIRLTATNLFGSNNLTQYSYITVTTSHNITATAGVGGTIAPSGEVTVTYGANQAFTITPNTGYHITDVVVDTVSQGAITTYTFNNVVATHTISASFAINAPTFTSITPNSGSTLGGTFVTITGTNLTGATGVTFGGTAATGVLVVDANTITATTPAHAAGAVNVVVTTPGGTATGTGVYTYVTPPPPTFGSITPNSGSTLGGTFVTITGTNLIGTTAVTFGGTAATAFTVVDANTITATTPAHAAGAVNVVVTTPGGTATGPNAYTYVAPPTVTARTNATLNRGWPGYERITGTGFVSGATSVLNTTTGISIASTTCNFISSTTMFCSYNLLGATVNTQYRVAVINPDGQSAIMNPPTSNYVSVVSPAPTLAVRSPTTAVKGWPVSVTLTGTNFQPGADVRLRRAGYSDIIATGVNVASPTSINAGTFDLLGVAAGTWNIVVINTDGTASNTRTFTVTSTVTVTSITPASGQHGTTVTITNIAGTGFQPGVTEVRFSRNTGTQNQILLTNINVESSTKISGTLVIPAGQTVQTLYVRVTNADATTGISGSRIFSVLT
jgi:PKD repeat protein